MNNNAQNITLTPIGYVRTDEKYRAEAPRQSTFAKNKGFIELNPHCNFETALSDLASFDRIWVIFFFHLNQNWKPKVAPPVTPVAGQKIGVFATRSPHRPNPIGLSCVELLKVEKLKIHIQNFDLLADTPVLDIKPYIPVADAFPDANCGWLEQIKPDTFNLSYSGLFVRQNDWLKEYARLDAHNFCQVQLTCNPLQRQRKRLYAINSNLWEIGLRTWRILFKINELLHQIEIISLRSNYNAEELLPHTPDPYGDKDIHRQFQMQKDFYIQQEKMLMED